MPKLEQRISVFAVVLTLALTLGALGQQVSPVEAKLVIPDAKVLPGVPFDMWIEVRNPSDAAVTIGLFPQLIVRTDRGQSFEIHSGASDFPVLLRGPRTEGEPVIRTLILAPGERRTLTLPIEDGLANVAFFREPRLSLPGRYTLAVRLERFPIGFESEPVALNFFGPVITNDAIVERIEPTGSDAKVWKRMQELANGRWSVLPLTVTSSSAPGPAIDVNVAAKSWQIWGEILTKYPGSNYVPYALLAGSGVDEKYRTEVVEAISRFPDSPVIEYLDMKARNLSAGRLPAVYEREAAKVQQSARPTTRIRAFGREDVPKPGCPPGIECER